MIKNLTIFALFLAMLLVSSTTFAGEQTATLSVPGMNCASCPYIIKSALSAVDGVKEVTATLEGRTAKIVFDAAVASIEAIQQATTDIGYPSFILKLNTGS
jgi:mercuric ion binding protein